jgi:hypothetical protein
MFGKGTKSITLEDILSKASEAQLLAHYLGIYKIPCVINSPLRKDKKPSFGIYSSDGKRIHYRDFAKGDSGTLIDLLSHIWGCSFKDTLDKINKDIGSIKEESKITKKRLVTISKKITDSTTDLQCKIREWKKYDIDYWKSYGIPLEWLNYAEVYPISHKIIIKEKERYVFSADKYAYAFVEHKDNKTTIKIYQPFNTKGFKWANKHDRSVISLWTKIPKKGNLVCICSSLKDALCLWANTGIPALAIQGEGYNMSETAINELKKRYKRVCIILDNDAAGIEDAIKLSNNTSFTNISIPLFDGGKDISDLYHVLQDKDMFKMIMINLINKNLKL